MFGLLPEHIIN